MNPVVVDINSVVNLNDPLGMDGVDHVPVVCREDDPPLILTDGYASSPAPPEGGRGSLSLVEGLELLHPPPRYGEVDGDVTVALTPLPNPDEVTNLDIVELQALPVVPDDAPPKLPQLILRYQLVE